MRKISDFRQYEESPFPVYGMDSRVVVKPGKTATMVGTDGSELHLEEPGQSKAVLHDQEQYIKVFRYGLDTMKFLNARAMCLVMLVMDQMLPRKNTVELNRRKAEAFSKKLAGASYYIALVELLDVGILARSKSKKVFYVNPNMLFNGDRRSLLKKKENVNDEEDC